MSRPRYNPPPFLSRREIIHLLLLVAGLVFVIQTMNRLRNPGSMNWMFGVDTTLSEVEAEAPNQAFAQIDKVEGDFPKEPANDAGDPGLAVNELEIGENEAPPAVPEASSKQSASNSNSFNPLGLETVGELQEINQVYLDDVEDEVDPARKTRVSMQKIRERRAKANDAVYQILGVASVTPPAELASRARKDVLLSNLWKTPEQYRGEVVHVKGVLHRLELVAEELNLKNPYAIDKIYEAWVFLEEFQAHVRVWFTSLPEGLQVGGSLKENIEFDAYFLKLYAFKAQDDKWHTVPMLLGYQPEWIRVDMGPLRDQAEFFSLVIGGIILLGIVCYWYLRRKDERESAQLRTSTASRPPDDVDFLDSSEIEENPFTGEKTNP